MSFLPPDCAIPQTRRLLYESIGMSVTDFCCRAHVEALGPEEPNATHSIVFIRRGLFQRSQHRETLVADPNYILFFNAAHPYRYSHPLAGGDDCTILAVTTNAALNLVARRAPWDAEEPEKPFHVPYSVNSPCSARLHYELLALLRARSPELIIEDALAELAHEAIRAAYASHGQQRRQIRSSPSAAGVLRRHRELTEAAKLAINEKLQALPTLNQLAHDLSCSPFHLSRVFHQIAGMSLRRYVGRLRVNVAADRLSRGTRDLTDLALDLGFADHSHFTNAFRREWGCSPSRLRARFALS
jgi:AraC-like DNA-binding protein